MFSQGIYLNCFKLMTSVAITGLSVFLFGVLTYGIIINFYEKILIRRKKMIKKAFNIYKDTALLALVACVIGVVVGILDAGFGGVLLYITQVREEHYKWFIPFLPLVGGLMILAFQKFGKSSIKGMGLVFEARFDKQVEIPLRLVPFTIITTWLTHLFGGSAGREGVSIQIGATVANGISKKVKIKNASKILLVTGMAAGFSGLFQTPIAAVFFALEVLITGALEYEAIVPAVAAAVISARTSHLLGLEKFSVPLDVSVNVDFSFAIKLVIISIIFGITGGVFARGLRKAKEILGNIFSNPIYKIMVVGALIAILSLLINKGRYSGLGTNLIGASFNGGEINYYDWILKLLFTIVTLACGFQGGEVTPLFAIGASLGVVLGGIFGLPVMFIGALGYAGVFSGATNTFIGPMFIGAEVFGFKYIPYFFLVCAISHIVSGNQSIYPAQKTNKS